MRTCSAISPILACLSGAGPGWQIQVHERCLELVSQGCCREECFPLRMLRPQRLQRAVHLCPKRPVLLLRVQGRSMKNSGPLQECD